MWLIGAVSDQAPVEVGPEVLVFGGGLIALLAFIFGNGAIFDRIMSRGRVKTRIRPEVGADGRFRATIFHTRKGDVTLVAAEIIIPRRRIKRWILGLLQDEPVMRHHVIARLEARQEDRSWSGNGAGLTAKKDLAISLSGSVKPKTRTLRAFGSSREVVTSKLRPRFYVRFTPKHLRLRKRIDFVGGTSC